MSLSMSSLPVSADPVTSSAMPAVTSTIDSIVTLAPTDPTPTRSTAPATTSDPVCSGNNWDRGTATDPNAPPGPYPIKGEQVYIQDPNNYCINLPNPESPFLIENYYSQGQFPSFVRGEGSVRSFCVGALSPGSLPMPPGAVKSLHITTNRNLNGKAYHQITGTLDCEILNMTCTGDNGGQYDNVPYKSCGKEPYSGVDVTKNPGFIDYVEIGGNGEFCMRTCVEGNQLGDPCNVKNDTNGCEVLTGGTMDRTPGFKLNGVEVKITATLPPGAKTSGASSSAKATGTAAATSALPSSTKSGALAQSVAVLGGAFAVMAAYFVM